MNDSNTKHTGKGKPGADPDKEEAAPAAESKSTKGKPSYQGLPRRTMFRDKKPDEAA